MVLWSSGGRIYSFGTILDFKSVLQCFQAAISLKDACLKHYSASFWQRLYILFLDPFFLDA